MSTILHILILAAIAAGIFYTCRYLNRFAAWANNKMRDQEIEAEMRLGMRDAQRQREIARRIIEEESMWQERDRQNRRY